jgi:hypothetical protein
MSSGETSLALDNDLHAKDLPVSRHLMRRTTPNAPLPVKRGKIKD